MIEAAPADPSEEAVAVAAVRVAAGAWVAGACVNWVVCAHEEMTTAMATSEISGPERRFLIWLLPRTVRLASGQATVRAGASNVSPREWHDLRWEHAIRRLPAHCLAPGGISGVFRVGPIERASGEMERWPLHKEAAIVQSTVRGPGDCPAGTVGAVGGRY